MWSLTEFQLIIYEKKSNLKIHTEHDLQRMNDLVRHWLTVIFSVCRVIFYKKTPFVSLYELDLLQEAINFVKLDVDHVALDSYFSVVNTVRQSYDRKEPPIVQKSLLSTILRDIYLGAMFEPVEIPILDGFSVNCNTLVPRSRIPRLTFKLTDDPFTLPLVSSELKSVLIIRSERKGYHYATHTHGKSIFLKLLVGHDEEINRTLLLTIANDTDSIIMSLDLFEMYFNVIKESRSSFRYIEIYEDHKYDGKSVRERVKHLASEFNSSDN